MCFQINTLLTKLWCCVLLFVSQMICHFFHFSAHSKTTNIALGETEQSISFLLSLVLFCVSGPTDESYSPLNLGFISQSTSNLSSIPCQPQERALLKTVTKMADPSKAPQRAHVRQWNNCRHGGKTLNSWFLQRLWGFKVSKTYIDDASDVCISFIVVIDLAQVRFTSTKMVCIA